MAKGGLVAVGPSGGLVENLADLMGPGSEVIYHTGEGCTPSTGSNSMDVFENPSALEQSLSGAKVVLVSADRGDGEKGEGFQEQAFLTQVIQSIPSGVEAVVLLQPAEEDSASQGGLLSALFAKESPMKALESGSEQKGFRRVVIEHGNLFGPPPGKAPLPFVNGPKAAPIIEDSYTKKSVVVLNSGSAGSVEVVRGGKTLRSTLAQAAVQAAQRNDRDKPMEIRFSLVSVEGSTPTKDDWDKEFKILEDPSGTQVYFVEASAVADKEGLLEFFETKWWPKTLNYLNVEMTRSGERPVRMITAPSKDQSSIVWESLDEDLRAIRTGTLDVIIEVEDDKSGVLRVVRTDGSGNARTTPLKGEEEVLSAFIEGVNTMAFGKGFLRKQKAKKPASKPAGIAAAVPIPASATSAASPSADGATADQPNSGKSKRASRPGRRKTRSK
eukprot:CAMPEP_0113943488 /NCGR_PEP_ID=MMETSP1339-20121228/24926_1 /TAXON_ID=94617 /ORGANISM="Fibrocapsa japonica" /LENGTH=441 /DNA_ID=CAMNT_0000948373 /DNA_START=189 /DNA_END=1514 /DNA_ORIENTATION=- /assembly_acc=CAM_ASM_000762